MNRYLVEMTCGPIWIFADEWFPEAGFLRFFKESDFVADLPRVLVKKICRKNYDGADEVVIVM